MLGWPRSSEFQRACLAERPPRCEIVQDHAARLGVGERWAAEEVGLGVASNVGNVKVRPVGGDEAVLFEASTHELGGHVQQDRGFELDSLHVFEMVGLAGRRPFGRGARRPDGGREPCAALPYVRLSDNVAQGLVPTVALDGNEGGSTNACRLVGPGKRSETCRLAAATADALLDLHARGEAVRSGSVQLPDQGHSFGVSQLLAA